MTTTTAEVEIPTIVPDGRTVLAKWLSKFDEAYDLHKQREAEFRKSEATLKAIKDTIKEEVDRLGYEKVNLDHPALRFLLSYTEGTQVRMTAEDTLRFRLDHPSLWALYSTVVPTVTIRRLTGAQWLKRSVR